VIAVVPESAGGDQRREALFLVGDTAPVIRDGARGRGHVADAQGEWASGDRVVVVVLVVVDGGAD